MPRRGARDRLLGRPAATLAVSVVKLVSFRAKGPPLFLNPGLYIGAFSRGQRNYCREVLAAWGPLPYKPPLPGTRRYGRPAKIRFAS